MIPGSNPLVGFWLLEGQKPKPKVKPNTPLTMRTKVQGKNKGRVDNLLCNKKNN
jgi:hypothetical protein